MTDYPKALAAAREAHTYVKHRGMTRAEAALGDLIAAIDAARGEAVAFLYTLEYGSSVADRKASTYRLHYPFGVCGADYQRSREDGVSYVRETPLYAAPPAALAVPAGYALVPVEPTQAMLDAAGMCIVPDGKEWLDQSNRETWAAMLAAANKENNNG